MEALINTTLVVALGEMGDKTQVLALLLAVRYGRPWPILLGIFLATLCTMGVTAFLGSSLSGMLQPVLLRWLLVMMFLAVAVWTLIPEDDDDDESASPISSTSLIVTAFVTFLLAELGDKSQVATLVMAAKYHQFDMVMIGATLGEMLAIAPAVLLGKTTAQWIPLKWIRLTAAALFAGLGVWVAVFGLD